MNSRVRIFDFAHEFPLVTQHWSYLTMRSGRRSTVVETQGFQFLHDSDDGLIAMETLPASFLHLLVGIVTICLPWQTGSKNSNKVKDIQISGTALLTATPSPHPASFHEKTSPGFMQIQERQGIFNCLQKGKREAQ